MKSRTKNTEECSQIKPKFDMNSNKALKKRKKDKKKLITVNNEINSHNEQNVKRKKDKTFSNPSNIEIKKSHKNKNSIVSNEKVNTQSEMNVVKNKHKNNKTANDKMQHLETNNTNKKKKFKKSTTPKSFKISTEMKITENQEGARLHKKSEDKKRKNKFHKKFNKVQKLKIIKERQMMKKKLQLIAENNVVPINHAKKIKYNNNHTININLLKKVLGSIEENRPTIEENSSENNQSELLSLRDKMMTKLRASRFRYINETLYTSESSEAKKYFRDNPDDFTAYHNGYKQQVSQWPLNPLDVIIASINKLPKTYVIADFGCGEAKLAESVPQNVHSFDLVAVNERVKACDMAHTPLLTDSVNVVVFCLSLMGTNLADYLREANRVLKKDGILKIAEVESRFDNVEDFIKTLESFGFVNTWKDLSHNLFYFMDFKKSDSVIGKRSKLPDITLKPCLYKKR